MRDHGSSAAVRSRSSPADPPLRCALPQPLYPVSDRNSLVHRTSLTPLRGGRCPSSLDTRAGALARFRLIDRINLDSIDLGVVGPMRARFGFCLFGSSREESSGEPRGSWRPVYGRERHGCRGAGYGRATPPRSATLNRVPMAPRPGEHDDGRLREDAWGIPLLTCSGRGR